MTTPPTGRAHATTPVDIERLRRHACLAALTSAVLFGLAAAGLVIIGRERWDAYGDFSYSYANSGFGLALAVVGLAAQTLLLGVLLMSQRRSEPPSGYAAGLAGMAQGTGWLVRTLTWVLLLGSLIPIGYQGPAMYWVITKAPYVLVGLVALLMAATRLVRYARAIQSTGPRRLALVWSGRLLPVLLILAGTIGFRAWVHVHASYQRMDAIRAVWHLSACAHRHAQRHPERGFPQDEEELERDPQCRIDAIIDGPFTADYVGVRRDARGPVTSFIVRTAQHHLWGQRYESLVANEAGLIHVAFRRPATFQDHSAPFEHSSPQMFQGCLRAFHWRSGQRGYPLHLVALQRLAPCGSPEHLVAPAIMDRVGYRITYHLVGAFVAGTDTLARGFLLHARPKVYGSTGLRSYFLDPSGVMRATGAERPATTSDPPVPDCEFDSMSPWKECEQRRAERR